MIDVEKNIMTSLPKLTKDWVKLDHRSRWHKLEWEVSGGSKEWKLLWAQV